MHIEEMEKELSGNVEFIKNPIFLNPSIVEYFYYTLFKFIPYDIEINANAFVIPKNEASLANTLEFCKEKQINFVIEEGRNFNARKLRDPYGQKVCSFYIIISLAYLNEIVS